MKYTWWKSGDWNAICDECGFKFKASELRERWEGYKVCAPCWEVKHPQEMIRPIPDQSKLPWTRPEGTDQFVAAVCTVVGRQGVAGLGVAGCAIAGLNLGYKGLIDITHDA